MVVERRSRHRLRRQCRLEAFRENTAHGARHANPVRARDETLRRRARQPQPDCAGLARHRRVARERSSPAGHQCYRLHAHGPRTRARRRRALRSLDPRTRRQQRHDSGAVRQARSCPARHHICRRRHGRPALHQSAPPFRSRVGLRQTRSIAEIDLLKPPHRQPAGQQNSRRPADRRSCIRQHGTRALNCARRRRHDRRRRARARTTRSSSRRAARRSR